MSRKKWEMPKGSGRSASGFGKPLAIGIGISMALTLGLSAFFATLMDRQMLGQEIDRCIGDRNFGSLCCGRRMERSKAGRQQAYGDLLACGWGRCADAVCCNRLFLRRRVPGDSQRQPLWFWGLALWRALLALA